MLFDLQGRRHRAVQILYAILAFVMVGGFIFLGVGGTNGSIVDIFRGNNDPYSQQIKQAEKEIEKNPKNAVAYDKAIQAFSQRANSQVNDDGSLKKEATKDFEQVDKLWSKYPNKQKAPSSTLQNALTVYSNVINNPNEATKIAEIMTQKDPSATNYSNLAYFALLAGQKDQAEAAEKQALSKARTKKDRENIKAGIKALKQQLKAAEVAQKDKTPSPSK